MITLLAIWICVAYKATMDLGEVFVVTLLLDMLLLAFLASAL